jgi:Fe-S cluster assembly iron-binding protein IscA
VIEISDMDKSRIKELMDKNSGKSLRIEVEGDGCAGPYFQVFLDAADPAEKPTEINGIAVLVSAQVQKYAEVTTINIFVNHVSEDFA